MTGVDVRAALLAAVPAGSGDWADVAARAAAQRRGVRRRRRVALILAFALLLVGAGTTLALGSRFFDWFGTQRSHEQAPTLPAGAPYVLGATLYRAHEEPQQLSHPLLAPLLGQDAILAVMSPGGRYLAYHSSGARSGTTVLPLLYVHDTATGRDRLLARGAQTVAWSGDGRIAYFRATRARYDGRNGAYVGHVVVRTLSTPEARWTTNAGGYEVLAWARGRLLVGVRRCFFSNCRRDPARGVYVLSEAGALRPLPLATVGALSPDGRYAFGRYDPVPGQDSPSALVRVVEIATGRPVATVDLGDVMRRAGLRGDLPGAIKAGAWRRSEIVVSFGGRDSALAFLRLRGRRLEVESVARIPPQTLRTRYGVAFGVPLFTSGANVVVPIRGERRSGRYVVSVAACSRVTHRCLLGRVLPVRRWFAVAVNPSRPLPSRR